MWRFLLFIISFFIFQTTSHASTADEICVIDAIIHEAGGEIDEGKIGVAYVIKNRSLTTGYSPCYIVHEQHNGQYQFSFMAFKHTLPKKTFLWVKAQNITRQVLHNEIKDITNGAQFFHRCSITFALNSNFKFVKKIGHHCYYKDRKITDKYSDIAFNKAKHFNPALHIPGDMLNNT